MANLDKMGREEASGFFRFIDAYHKAGGCPGPVGCNHGLRCRVAAVHHGTVRKKG